MPDNDAFAGKTPPKAPLRIAYLAGCGQMARSIDTFILNARKRTVRDDPYAARIHGYLPESFLVKPSLGRFGTGEGRATLGDSMRGCDLFILSDVTNSSLTYKVFGKTNHMSPDNHFQDIKRLISATSGTPERISVVMPFLYEGRQHKRSGRESLDCAMALKELAAYGVSELITFDAHDPSVQNAIPLRTFNNFMPTYQFVRALVKSVPDLKLDNDHLIVISPDEGAMSRAVYLSNLLGVDIGVFYKRRDYSRVVNGKNPIVAHEYLGDSIVGKDAVVIDDMISSGGSMLDVCKQLKDKGVNRVFICCTFGLFTDGLDQFDKYYEEGYFHKLITTNVIYRSPELLKRPYYETANMYQYMASIIDTLNHNMSAEKIRGTTSRITRILESTRGSSEKTESRPNATSRK